jgi:hypothetical protein
MRHKQVHLWMDRRVISGFVPTCNGAVYHPASDPWCRGDTRWLAFSSDPSRAFEFEIGNSKIDLIRTDGSGHSQLPTASGNDLGPA